MDVKEFKIKWYKDAAPESGKLYLVTGSTGQVFMAQCCSWIGSENGDYWNVLIYLTDPSGRKSKVQLAMEQRNIEPGDAISCVDDILFPEPIGNPEDESKWGIVRRLSELQDAMKGCTDEIKELRQLFLDLHDMVKQLQLSKSTPYLPPAPYPQDPGIWPGFPHVYYRTGTGVPPMNERFEIK